VKKQLILLFMIIFIGGLVVILPYFRSQDNKTNKTEQDERQKLMDDISSKPETIDIQDIPHEKRESEQFDKEQMYFENIDALYKYFKFDKVEDIKQRTQSYIHSNINKDILDCKLNTDSIKESNGVITFELKMVEVKYFEVQVTKDNEGNIVDISIISSII
jgi:hypothetical protein